MNKCFFRRLMDKRCCCWTFQQCKSVWTSSWDQPSSCATTLRGSSWHFINSLPRSWREVNMDLTTLILCFNPMKNTVFPHFNFFFYTGHPLESCKFHMVMDQQGHQTFLRSSNKRSKTNTLGLNLFSCSLGRHWRGLKDRKIQGT